MFNTQMGVELVENTRLANARRLAAGFDSQAEFAAEIGRSATQVSRFMGKNASKPIGKTIARDIEKVFKKAPGWLDVSHDTPEHPAMGGALGKMLKDPSSPAPTPGLVKDITLAHGSDEEWKLDPDEVEILRAWRTLPEDSKSIIQAMFRAQVKGGAH